MEINELENDLETVKSIVFTLARQYERIDRTVDRIALQQQQLQIQTVM
jgi:hypothetical protein